jgi:plastocyanin
LRLAAGVVGTSAIGVLTACGLSGSAGSGESADVVVKMNDEMQFNPELVIILFGTTVRFENVGRRMVHTATCDPDLVDDAGNVRLPEGAPAWDSGNVEPGSIWRHQFDVPGEYRYVCLPHELAGMIGTIVVENE